MMVSAHDVAAYLRERIPGLATLKLHKLLYYTQAHHLAATGKPLFSESVMAWDMGPVVAQLRYAEKKDGLVSSSGVLTDRQLNIIDYVVSRYRNLTGVDLMHLTHAEDPWQRADTDRPKGGSVRIRDEWMRDYFRAEQAMNEGEVWFSQEKIAELTRDAQERRQNQGPVGPDETALLRERLAEVEAQLGAE